MTTFKVGDPVRIISDQSHGEFVGAEFIVGGVDALWVAVGTNVRKSNKGNFPSGRWETSRIELVSVPYKPGDRVVCIKNQSQTHKGMVGVIDHIHNSHLDGWWIRWEGTNSSGDTIGMTWLYEKDFQLYVEPEAATMEPMTINWNKDARINDDLAVTTYNMNEGYYKGQRESLGDSAYTIALNVDYDGDFVSLPLRQHDIQRLISELMKYAVAFDDLNKQLDSKK